jgi:hypothetical protein
VKLALKTRKPNLVKSNPQPRSNCRSFTIVWITVNITIGIALGLVKVLQSDIWCIELLLRMCCAGEDPGHFFQWRLLRLGSQIFIWFFKIPLENLVFLQFSSMFSLSWNHTSPGNKDGILPFQEEVNVSQSYYT